MSNRVFQSLVDQAISDLVNYYNSTKEIFWNPDTQKLTHPGEYGNYREKIVEKLLRLFLPSRLGIGSGFIISNAGDVSTQCDLIIYDRGEAPPLENNENQKFFPVELVVGVGEVKSNVRTPGELRTILGKLASVKKLRENTRDAEPMRKFHVSPFDLVGNPLDQMFTFVFANKFEFDPTAETVLNYPPEISPRHWHNAIATIDDGTYSYKTRSGKVSNLFFPCCGGVRNEFHVVKKQELDTQAHLKFFLLGFSNGLKNTTTLSMDNVLYLTDEVQDKIE